MASSAHGQRPDPTMQLLLSQPPVDLSSPVVATAVVDPPVVPVGELAVYRITLNALEASVRWPAEFPPMPNLSLTASGSGQVLPLIANVQRPTTARNFHLRAARPGLYTLPAFEVEAYGQRVLVPEAQLEVLPAAPADFEPARQLYVQVARTNVFVGETVPVTVLSPGTISNVVSGLSQIQFNGAGLHGAKVSTRQLVEQRELNGHRRTTVIYESTITPLVAGPLQLSAQGFTAGMFFTGPVVLQGQVSLQGFATENLLLDSEPIHLNVQALPTISESRGFTGFIGQLSVAPPHASTNTLRVGDALRLLVMFRGDANVGRLIPPPAPRAEGWQIYPASPADPLPGLPTTNVVVAFAYTLIPTTEEVKHTPAIPFQIFDPLRAAYVDLTIPSVPVAVTAEGLPTNWVAEIAAMETEALVEARPRLSELAKTPGVRITSMQPLQLRSGFGGLQLAPVAGLLVWWGAERRRRFLEAHPEIVRRREARRALRRERRVLQRAVTARDAEGFARSAVTALQIVTAPHFPATPRAIVCRDVLGFFEEAEQRGRTGDIIRNLYAENDARHFARQGHDHRSLLDCKLELERILRQMEAKL